ARLVCATTGRASPPMTSRTCSTASGGPSAPGAHPDQVSGSRSSARWPTSTAPRSRSRPPRTAAPACACASPAEKALLRAQGQVGFGFGVDEGLAVDVDDHAVEPAGETERGPVVVDDRHRPVVAAGQAGVGDREACGRETGDVARADLVAVDQQRAATLVLAGLVEP